MNIYKIVLTGGPCAGKTTILENVKHLLKKSRYYVITIDETARTLIKGNLSPSGSYEHILNFQEDVFKYQLLKEQIAYNHAKSLINTKSSLLEFKKGIIILQDRGLMDNRAYLSHQDYTNLINKFNFNELELVNSYDLIIDLISIATTNPELYETDNERYETKDMAAKRDEITSGACLLHRNLTVIKPTETIEEKTSLVYQNIIDFIKNKEKEELETFEIIDKNFYLPKLEEDNSRTIKLISYYIKNNNSNKYILHRKTYQNHTSFILTSKDNTYQYIDHETFNNLLTLNLLEPFYHSNITYFIHKGNYYELEENSNGIYLKTNNHSLTPIGLKKTLKKQ